MLDLLFILVQQLLFRINQLSLLFILSTSHHSSFISSIDKGHLELSRLVLVMSADEVNV